MIRLVRDWFEHQSDWCEIHTLMRQSGWCEIHTLIRQLYWCEIHTLTRRSDWREQHTTLQAKTEFFSHKRKKKLTKKATVAYRCFLCKRMGSEYQLPQFPFCKMLVILCYWNRAAWDGLMTWPLKPHSSLAVFNSVSSWLLELQYHFPLNHKVMISFIEKEFFSRFCCAWWKTASLTILLIFDIPLFIF